MSGHWFAKVRAMAIDRSGTLWKGSNATDLDEYLGVYTEDADPVGVSVHASCQRCGSDEFKVRVDPDEGCAERVCTECAERAFMLDSEECVEDATLEAAGCPCGGESFNVAVGFALREDPSDVKWIYLGLRCVRDGVLGCFADWKIDYSPSASLMDSV
jgi:hypothetical protein